MSLIRFAVFLVSCFFLSAEISYAAGGGNMGGPAPANGSRRGPDLNEVFREGAQLLADGSCKKAEKKFKTVLKAISTNPEANLLRGAALQCQGKHKAASRYFKKAKRYNGELYAAYRMLGVSYIELGRRDDAKEELDELAALLEDCAGSCPGALSKAHSELKNELDRTIQDKADSPSDTENDQHGLLFETIAEPQTAYLAAVQHIHAERFNQAIEDLRRLTAEIGPHPDVLTYLGYAHKRLGRFDAARRYYDEALAIDGSHRGAHEYLGEMWVELGRLEAAREHLAALDRACPFGCTEYGDLERLIGSSVAEPR